MNRLIVLRWPPGNRTAAGRANRAKDGILADPTWVQILERRGCALFVRAAPNDVSPIVSPHDMGLVLGPLFRTEDNERMTAIGADLAAAWCASDGKDLTRHYWGSYLAVLCDREQDRVLIVRDPMGARPCFLSLPDGAGFCVVFTDLEDVLGLTTMEEIDVGFFSSFLLYPRLVTTKTGFTNVREILGGECVALGRTGVVEASTAWSPPIAAPRAARDFSQDAKRLSDVVRACGRAWTDLGLPIVHRLSGGLDSSIVLAALAGAEDGQVHAAIDFPADCPEGDERNAARAVADAFGVPLTEVEYRADRISYARAEDGPLGAKPSLADLSFADVAFAQVLGEPDRLRILSSGQGGDQVFHKADPMPGVADGVKDGLGWREVIALALDAARLSRRSVYAPLLSGVLNSGPWPRAYLRHALEARFADASASSSTIGEIMAHPWLDRADCKRSGQALRAMLLADVQYYQNRTVLTERSLAVPILTSQPIVELCASLPLYHMHRGGADRALARAAFAEVLPASSVARFEKGDTTRFHANVAKHNNGFLREVLFDGELMRLGLITPAQVEAMLATAPAAGRTMLNVSAHLAAELWLRKSMRQTRATAKRSD